MTCAGGVCKERILLQSVANLCKSLKSITVKLKLALASLWSVMKMAGLFIPSDAIVKGFRHLLPADPMAFENKFTCMP